MGDHRRAVRRSVLERLRRWRERDKKKKAARSLPTRDSVADAAEAVRFRDGVIRSGLATIPIAGVIVFTIKLLIQTRGDTNLALAIIANLPLATVAFLLLLTLIPYLSAGIVAGSAKVYYNLQFSSSVRRVAGLTCIVGVLVIILALPWWLLVIALAYVLLERASEGRETVRSVSFETWAARGAAPEDLRLRDYWNRLRELMREKGDTVKMRRGEATPQESRSLTWGEVTALVGQRYADIAAARPKTPMTAIYIAIVAIIAAFGTTIITGPIRLAPTEHVVFADGSEKVGYVFSNTSSQVLFVESTMQSSMYVRFSEMVSRELCSSDFAYLGRTTLTLLATPSEPECPRLDDSED